MEVSYFKEQLQAKEEMLAQTTRFLLASRQELEDKNDALATANKEIFDSINFAAPIQKSLLPEIDVLKIFFRDAAYKVIQQIGIGGDTVFIKNTNKGVVFGLLDSTGHGIPGALLSISGTLLLKELMTSMEIDNPRVLLNLLNNQLHATFNNSRSSIAHKEGVICSFSSAQNKLSYSSAKGKALFLRSTGDILELATTKKSIGEAANTEFDFFDMQVSPGDKLIMYSDGLTDQFGGEKNKKFSRERLKQLLSTWSVHSASRLAQLVEEEFLRWKGGNKQTDDVSFMIIEF